MRNTLHTSVGPAIINIVHAAGIVEEQGGFRPRRGTDDQLFALTETLRLRTGKVTYAAFIDVKKAYDTVWRVGLWRRLWEDGVRGKMWRVVRECTRQSRVQSWWERKALSGSNYRRELDRDVSCPPSCLATA